MENPEESKKRLEQHVKRVASISVNDSGADFGSSQASVHDMVSYHTAAREGGRQRVDSADSSIRTTYDRHPSDCIRWNTPVLFVA